MPGPSRRDPHHQQLLSSYPWLAGCLVKQPPMWWQRTSIFFLLGLKDDDPLHPFTSRRHTCRAAARRSELPQRHAMHLPAIAGGGCRCGAASRVKTRADVGKETETAVKVRMRSLLRSGRGKMVPLGARKSHVSARWCPP